MVTSIVYTLIGLILCFVLYIAFRAINTGMEAKKANKDLESSKNVNLANQEDLVEKLTELKELHEKKILSGAIYMNAKEDTKLYKEIVKDFLCVAPEYGKKIAKLILNKSLKCGNIFMSMEEIIL